jgi:ABC-type amino acid transport substrate-binding protein
MKSICDVTLTPETSVKVYTISDPIPLPRSGEVFDRISKSKVLRVGYHPDTLPFCFENSFNQISGYDMAFAYELAHDLGCSLELIPINFSTLTEDLNQGLYDIAMSAVSITKDRLEKICFSDPYIDAQVVFVMRKKFRKEFPSLEAVQLKPHVTIAALRGSSYEALARALFPSHPIATIESYEDFAHRYPNAILIRGEPQAIAWSLRYPNFTVVKPATPFYRENLAYAVPSNSERLLCFLNPWLKLKKNSGFTEETYNLWVLGKTDHITPQEPRWSLIRNTLHWVD